MTISISTTFELQSTGSDTNGGGFVTGSAGTDYSTSAKRTSPTFTTDISTTDVVTTGTATITSATANFQTTIVGNIIYIQGGTGSIVAGWYQVLTRVSATTITVDRVTGLTTGTGATINIGGPFASLGILVPAGVTTNNVFVKLGTYTVSSATVNVAGGVFSSSVAPNFIGYNTNRTTTNTDSPPTFQFGVSGVSLMLSRGYVYNMIFDGNGQTTARLSGASDTTNYNSCMIKNMNLAGTGGSYTNCQATTNSAAVFTAPSVGCEAYANTATPYSTVGITANALSYNNTGSTTDGFNVASINAIAINCIAYNNGRDGFSLLNSGRVASCINCHAENNAGWGFNTTANTAIHMVLINCSAYNNTLGTVSSPTTTSNYNFITVTAGSVFVNAAGGNFALNNITSQGALLRAAASPALFPAGLTASYRDIGAAQHQDTGGGGNTFTGFVIF